MKLRYNHIILFTLFSIFLACTQEDDMNNGLTSANRLSLKLVLSASGSTRALVEPGEDNLNENLINTLDVFIYRDGDETCASYERKKPETDLTNIGEYLLPLEATQDMFISQTSYTTYVLANYTGNIPAGGLTLSELNDLTVSSLNPDKTQDYFIMDGWTSMVLNDGLVIDKEIVVSVKRAAAKIRITTTYTNGYTASPTTEISKKFMQYAASGNALDNGTITSQTLQSMTGFTNISSGAGNNSRIILYSYPNDWNKNIRNETYAIVNIPVISPEGTEISQNYYKVPLNYRLSSNNAATTAEKEALYKLQRNYLYDIIVQVDQPGAATPEAATEIKGTFIIQDWSTKEVLVTVEGINFIYVKDTHITLPNSTKFTTTFQSSTPDVEVTDIKVNGTTIANNTNGVNIICQSGVKNGAIRINSSLPTNFVEKAIEFTVKNGAGLTQKVTVAQYPALYIGADISADEPGGSQGQNNNKMYIISSFVADFSTLPDPDEFDETFPSGYYHYAPQPALGASYAKYIRDYGILGYPKTDSEGATIDNEDNNRRISPRLMLASQYGVTTASDYASSRLKCRDYVENDKTTGERYSDWRMPTLAEVYLTDVLQNIKACDVKEILEGGWYWSTRASGAVNFMDPRVGNTTDFNSLFTSIRCVRDVK